MGAGIIELISNIVKITGNPIADTIIFVVIGLISGSIAFDVVGLLFSAIGKYDSKTMSDVHWGVRVFIFALLTFILVKIAQLLRWIFSTPQVYFLICIIVITIIALVFVSISKKKRKINKLENSTPVQQPEKEKEQPTSVENQYGYRHDVCPFCEGKLVQRKGPYGRFLGCINFPKCKYTRKQDYK